jgi:hypothetical protein
MMALAAVAGAALAVLIWAFIHYVLPHIKII